MCSENYSSQQKLSPLSEKQNEDKSTWKMTRCSINMILLNSSQRFAVWLLWLAGVIFGPKIRLSYLREHWSHKRNMWNKIIVTEDCWSTLKTACAMHTYICNSLQVPTALPTRAWQRSALDFAVRSRAPLSDTQRRIWPRILGLWVSRRSPWFC